MKTKFQHLVFVSSLFFSLNLSAQCPTCDLALQKDTRDYYTNELRSDFKSTLQEIFSHDYSYYESGDWLKNTALQSGGSYGIISGFLNGNQSSEEKKLKFETLKSSFLANQTIESDLYKTAAQSINSGIFYTAWTTCVKDCNDPHLDLPILTSNLTGNSLTVTLYWKSNNGNDHDATIRDISYGNLTSNAPGSLFISGTIQPRNSYSKNFTITDIHQPCYVNVIVTGFDPATIVIPAVPKDNIANNNPIGTIIASVLDFKRFCIINGQPETINYSDSLHCKWVPADGRGVQGSRYGTIQNNVPDLRGVFLRAVNDFGVPGVQNVDQNQAEKDAQGNIVNRAPNNFELDDFKSHSHQISGNGPGNPAGGWALENVGRIGNANTSAVGGAETRPKNITVYYYIKIN